MSRGLTCLVLLAALTALLGIACAKPAEISATRGHELYMAYGCAACHGPDGDGKGPAAGLSKIPPRDLGDLSAFVTGTSLDEIARSIEYGMKATGMPAYAELPRDERLSMATWILSIAEEEK
jgi:mono/diheme cytochrome c family protein